GLILSIIIFLPITKAMIGIIAGVTVLLIVGLIDDKKKNFNPYLRLAFLFLAAAFAVGAGIGISFLNNPLTHLPILSANLTTPIIYLDQIVIPIDFFGSHKIILLADILAFIWIVALTQIINWSKGVDGQMPGITLVAAIVLGILSLKFYFQGDINQLPIAKLAFITAGVSLGFLVFNWHPAKILPGFSGSTILAYLLAILAILSGAKMATALLVLGIPTIDFIFTFYRRVSSGKSPVWGDRGHLHHRLYDDLGWSHQKISLFYILGSVILGAIALFVDTQSKIFALIVVSTIFVGFILWLNSFGDLSKQPGPDNG
ncbi:MAG: MraY family glycosyltransferase, partial [Candidatus Daviesbacteria bacterium]|nr:MraY family glycosyltransferase [Candidatus Daviesbacteria bacterium]